MYINIYNDTIASYRLMMLTPKCHTFNLASYLTINFKKSDVSTCIGSNQGHQACCSLLQNQSCFAFIYSIKMDYDYLKYALIRTIMKTVSQFLLIQTSVAIVIK